MAHATQARGRSTGKGKGRLIAVVVLVIIAILAIIAGIIYLTEPARSLPAILGPITHPASRADAHRNLRGWVSLVVAVILLGAAWFTARARGADGRLGDRGDQRAARQFNGWPAERGSCHCSGKPYMVTLCGGTAPAGSPGRHVACSPRGAPVRGGLSRGTAANQQSPESCLSSCLPFT